MQLIHKDLGYYDKCITFHAAKQRYKIAMNLSWEEGEKELNSCISCQLYHPSSRNYSRIHLYDTKRAFEMWEIDFINLLHILKYNNKYIIMAI